jgi:signal transduction histidine kinase/ActR/RegA family two-component response regulator
VRPAFLIPVFVALMGLAASAAAGIEANPAFCAAPPTGLVYVGDASAPPVEFIDEHGKPAGIHIDLLRELERELGIPITVRLMHKLEATMAMQRGEAQLTALALADSRRAEFDFLAPTVRSRLSVMLRSEFSDRVATRDLSGLRIATTRESYTSRVLSAIEPGHRPTLVPVANRDVAAQLWKDDEIDGMAGSSAAMASLTRSRGLHDFVEVPIGTIVMHFVTNKGCGDQLAAVTTAMSRLREIGAVEAARERWVAAPESDFWRIAGYFGGAGLLLLAGVLGWNWTLRRQVLERTSALAAAKETAEAATRAKSEFLATMSHEIRTPLNAVIATASVLETTKLTTDQRELLEVIRRGGGSLLSVVTDVLDFSKIEAGHLELHTEAFDLRLLIDDVVQMVERTASDKGLAIASEVAGDVPNWVSGDAHRLRQVLLNLVTNAVKFTTIGRVDLRVTIEPSFDERRAIRVAVQDTGLGIPAGRLDRLFKPFTQVDSSTTRRFGGTGLGLTISRSLIELMGGEIGVTTEPGTGSTFWFCVPLAAADAPARRAGVMPARPAAPLRILMAEDNPVNQLVQRRMITHHGHTCDVVNDGEEAVSAAAASTYDVVVLDLQMPRMGGLEAAEAIRRQRHCPWLIVLTADATSETRRECLRVGMDDYLTKPITADAVAAALAKVPLSREEVA